MICRDDTGSGSNYKKAYLLTANGKKPTYAIHSMSTGSGGSSNDFPASCLIQQKMKYVI